MKEKEKENPRSIPEEELNFHYDRSGRLKRAPESVRQFYDGTAPKPPKGLFKALVHTSHGKFMLGAVVLSLLVVLVVLFFAERSNFKAAAGITFTLSAFSFEDSVYVSLKADKSGTWEGEPLHADIRFSAFEAGNAVLAERKNVLIYDGKEQFCRTIFTDYDIMSVHAEIRVGGETVMLRTRVEQK
ncbi:hypothetical protein V1L52_07375 [Treponema sp. HNW]|uniref:hypothetical protein n=1 Tax=Treponema sp. HNW TaxID=3116654 RepID=UPI003D111EA8